MRPVGCHGDAADLEFKPVTAEISVDTSIEGQQKFKRMLTRLRSKCSTRAEESLSGGVSQEIQLTS
jgi:hypothetical protein